MLRGLVFGAVMIVVRLIQGTIINAWPTQAGLVSLVLLTLFIVGVVVWGMFDGRADAVANPDPDRRQDLAMTWLVAGLVAGVLSGAVSWLIALVYKGLYTGGLINELTTFAAFTALVVFLPGITGVALGRRRVDRNPPPRREGGPEDERADTDVFAAARADDAAAVEPGRETAGAHAQGRTMAATALAEREAPTETIATTEHDAPTETIATTKHDAPTETIPTIEREAPTESIAAREREAPTESIAAREREGATETIPSTDDDTKTEVIRTDADPKHPGSEWPSSEWGKDKH
jgi:hypothetical protein